MNDSDEGSQEPRRRGPVWGRGLPSVSTIPFVIHVIGDFYSSLLSGMLFTRFTRARNWDKPKAKLIKASIYASKNLCYHFDGRHKLSEDRYTKATDTMAWASKIKEFVEYRLDPLTRELGRHLRAPMSVRFRILSFTFGQSATTRLRRVMSAYTDDRPYSLELVSAVSVVFVQAQLRIFIHSGDKRNGRGCLSTRCTI